MLHGHHDRKAVKRFDQPEQKRVSTRTYLAGRSRTAASRYPGESPNYNGAGYARPAMPRTQIDAARTPVNGTWGTCGTRTPPSVARMLIINVRSGDADAPQ